MAFLIAPMDRASCQMRMSNIISSSRVCTYGDLVFNENPSLLNYKNLWRRELSR
jgi:hypothetical protein